MDNSPEAFNILNSEPLRDMLYKYLRKLIIKGEFIKGERLVEVDLAKKFKVSRTPIREAIRKLEVEGLVEHQVRQGVIVKGFTTDDIVEIYSIRQALESLAITYVIKNITPKEIQRLDELNKKMEGLSSNEDISDMLMAFQEFNNVLIESCRMDRLISLISTYQEYLDCFRTITLSDKSRRNKALKDNLEMLQVIKDKDIKRAKYLTEQHIRGALDEYLSSLNKDQD